MPQDRILALVRDDTLDQQRKENAMIPLNDDWLSWPPDELDSFFITALDYPEISTVERYSENIDRSSREVCHEKS